MKKTIPQNHSIFRIPPPLKRLAFSAFTFIVLASASFTAMAQTWSGTGSLSADRYTHTATLLASGKVLVSGGYTTNGYTALSSCELYDPSTGTWSSTGSMATGRYIHTATLLASGKVLVTGGYGSSGYLSSCELYDSSTGTWSSTGSMTTGRIYHTATLLASGKVLVTGGDNSSYLSSCELYDPSTGTWSSTGSMTTDRVNHSATLLASGKVLVSGGIGNQGYTALSSCELYDPSTGTWSSTGSMASDRYYHTATLLASGKVFVTGGYSYSAGYLSSCELYDPSTGTWSSTGSMAIDRFYHKATILASGKVLVTGGYSNTSGTTESSCELYDPSTGTWSSTGSMAADRNFHTVTLLASGKVLVTGGYTYNGYTTVSGSELYGGGSSCTNPTVPTLSTSSSANCGAQSTTLNIAAGTLNDATSWQWYSGSCGGTSAGSGTSISVSPSVTTTYYARGEGGCVTPGSCASITITVIQPTSPDVPTLSASSSSICGNQTSTLSITGGSLNGATNWQWYSASCAGTAAGTGTSITVSPTATTTYYVRGEGGCINLGSCANTTVTVNGPSIPTGSNVYSGNITINTQTQMDAFFNNSNGEKYTKISGLLTLNGNHYSDPITSLCNLSSLVEITGNLNINNFNKSANPTTLSQLAALTTLGCGLNITSNTLLQDATLASLASIGCSVNIKDNNALQTINMPNLATVQGGQFNVKNNPKLELASASTTASSFSFTGKGSNMDISDNGSTAANALVMNFKKVTTLNGALVFNNNDNTGVSNFDNIFTGLTDLSTKWGKLTITNNDYLGTCCIAASVNVGGSSNRHIISGNTGNCLDSATVLANCGVFHKKSTSQSGLSNAFVEYNVYPNPSSGTFNLDVMSNEIGQLNISVTDLMGRTILTESHVISQYTSLPISLTSAASGTYFLKAEMNGEVFVKRIVLNK